MKVMMEVMMITTQ
jgi:hypothetical protein